MWAGTCFLNYWNVFWIVIHHGILSLEFFLHFQLAYTTLLSHLSALSSPRVALHLPLDGPSLHAAVAAVGLWLNRTAQTATGKQWIESKGEEAQTHTHHKAAECPAWPKPHPLMRSLVEEEEATAFNKSSAQPVLYFPWASLPGSPMSVPRSGLSRWVMTAKPPERQRLGEMPWNEWLWTFRLRRSTWSSSVHVSKDLSVWDGQMKDPVVPKSPLATYLTSCFSWWLKLFYFIRKDQVPMSYSLRTWNSHSCTHDYLQTLCWLQEREQEKGTRWHIREMFHLLPEFAHRLPWLFTLVPFVVKGGTDCSAAWIIGKRVESAGKWVVAMFRFETLVSLRTPWKARAS